MTTKPDIKILLVEDDRIDQIAFTRAVHEQGLPYHYVIVESIQQAREVLASQKFDMVISDFRLGDGNLFDILATITSQDMPLIVTTGSGDESTAVKAIKGGASDYIIKDTARNYLQIMPTTIEKVLKNKKAELEHQQAQDALRLSEERFSKAFQNSPVGMAITTLEGGIIIDINYSLCRLAGYTRHELLGHTSSGLSFWFYPNDYHFVRGLLRNRKSVREREFSIRHKSGEKRLMLFSADIIEINQQTCILSTFMDITARQQAVEEEIRYLSYHDRLTGLYNRSFFEEELSRINTENHLPLCLIMGDLNGLKLINDSMGHKEGDRLLKEAGAILVKSCRQEDIVARWGGDEFIILLANCDYKMGAHVVEQIQANCQNDEDMPIGVSISVGLACKDRFSQDIQEIIKEAEDKMYRHKLMESKNIRNSFISSLQKTLWTRSHETEGHCMQVREMALKLGSMVNLADSELKKLELLASLHDIGKIAFPKSMLEKPGKCTPKEWEALKKHPEIGYRIALSSPDLAPIAETILYHHEHWDGQGYPMGLKGENIPLLARIFAIVDTYDVLTNGRAYREAVRPDEAWQEIVRCAGTQFDPELVGKALELNEKTEFQHLEGG